MNFRLAILTLVLSLIFSMITHAESPNNWTIYYSDNDVKIEYKYTNCEYSDRFNQEFVILKITNLTNNNLSISWVNESWYDNKCINCSENRTDEALNEIFVPANQVIIGEKTLTLPWRNELFRFVKLKFSSPSFVGDIVYLKISVKCVLDISCGMEIMLLC